MRRSALAAVLFCAAAAALYCAPLYAAAAAACIAATIAWAKPHFWRPRLRPAAPPRLPSTPPGPPELSTPSIPGPRLHIPLTRQRRVGSANFPPRQPQLPPDDFWEQWKLGAARAASCGALCAVAAGLWEVPASRREWIKTDARRLLIRMSPRACGGSVQATDSILSSPTPPLGSAWRRHPALAALVADAIGQRADLAMRHRCFRLLCVYAAVGAARRELLAAAQAASSPLHFGTVSQIAAPRRSATAPHGEAMANGTGRTHGAASGAGPGGGAAPLLHAAELGGAAAPLLRVAEPGGGGAWDRGLWERDRCEVGEEKGRKEVGNAEARERKGISCAAPADRAAAAAVVLRTQPADAAAARLSRTNRTPPRLQIGAAGGRRVTPPRGAHHGDAQPLTRSPKTSSQPLTRSPKTSPQGSATRPSAQHRARPSVSTVLQ
eukprot:TRINITY_DN26596_c0_g1_i1.p1 TRINITY_DN26596_c0_g1~~TRINITY_DN26596_c0_g1_i1.p1  ORF type:complete len:437 (+),score=62.49 TRINITY_DN26596_c0_g1_i1:73-1383(+)